MNNKKVAIIDTNTFHYPIAPFNPGMVYPEYIFKDIQSKPNKIYEGVRNLLFLLGMDKDKFGTDQWNPLGEIIRPGSVVLLKPNLVRHYHPYEMDVKSIFTHGSIIRAVCDYVLIALNGKGKVIIADAALQSCDFEKILELSGINEIKYFYSKKSREVEVADLRLVKATVNRSAIYGQFLIQEDNTGDPRGYTNINLSNHSLHAKKNIDPRRYRVTCYNPSKMLLHHNIDKHEYVIANTLLQADIVINIPKMKTHRKAGITGALKNMIGINGHKDCLPHHIKGPVMDGGDEYYKQSFLKEIDSWIIDKKETRKKNISKKILILAHRIAHNIHKHYKQNPYYEGNWYGNDTISRTTLDLNRIVHYADKDGNITNTIQRKVFSIIDGIIAGEKDGPLAPHPKPCGVIIGGLNSVSVDIVMSRMMGFDYRKIKTYAKGNRS